QLREQGRAFLAVNGTRMEARLRNYRKVRATVTRLETFMKEFTRIMVRDDSDGLGERAGVHVRMHLAKRGRLGSALMRGLLLQRLLEPPGSLARETGGRTRLA